MHDHHHCCHDQADDAAKAVVDPVCGMQVDPAKTRHHAAHLQDRVPWRGITHLGHSRFQHQFAPGTAESTTMGLSLTGAIV